jgi:hypothetical protein
MMAAVFFMQPLGQIFSNIVSLIVVSISRNGNHEDKLRSVDSMWRWIIGIGVVPGIVALIFRFAIPETPRFLLDIEDDPVKAEFDATQLFGESGGDNELNNATWCESAPVTNPSNHSLEALSNDRASSMVDDPPRTTLNSSWTLSKADIIQYFWTEGNWRTPFATSMCWLLLDFGFYGIGLSSPQFLAKTWGSLRNAGPAPPWQTDPNKGIYDTFFDTSLHALVILNTGSFVGGVLWILASSRLNRVSLQKYGFLVLAALFIALGTVFITIHQEGALAICLYVVGQIAFNFGKQTYLVMPCLANIIRTQFDHLYHPCRAFPNQIPSYMPWYQCCSRQTRLDSSPGVFVLLQIWLLESRSRADETIRYHSSGI